MTNDARIEAIEQVLIEVLGAIHDNNDPALWRSISGRLEAMIEDARTDGDPEAKTVAEAINGMLSMAENKLRTRIE